MTNAKYIYVRRKTVKRIAALTVFLIIAGFIVLIVAPMLRRKPVVKVEVISRNALLADGKEIVYFRGISADSVFMGITLVKDSINTAQPIRLTKKDLQAVINRSIDILSQRISDAMAARKEMEYYASVHGVQDEGFGMVAAYDQSLSAAIDRDNRLLDTLRYVAGRSGINITHTSVNVLEAAARPSAVAVECFGGRWAYGRWSKAKHIGVTISKDSRERIVCAVCNADSIVSGRRTDSLGTYCGQMNRWAQAAGHGHYQANDGTYYEGLWSDDKREGFGFSVNSHKLMAGEWRADKYRGERMQYTSERIYGIDISRYQHGKGRKYYPILWNKLRITNLGILGNRNAQGAVGYPVSFIYIKSTEGTSVRNRYFNADYKQARKHGFRTGAYHFFSIRSSATAQANFFLRYSLFRTGDMPPVLDVEPTDAQIAGIGGPTVLFNHIRTWMNIVHRRTGVQPVLYVNQRFVNKYLSQAPDIKRNYNVWIARYGEYKPDVKLVYWQLSPYGRVAGIHGEVDINVFNGYRDRFNEFVTTATVK